MIGWTTAVPAGQRRWRLLVLPVFMGILAGLPSPALAGSPRPETGLVLVGGGSRPAVAMARFVAWAGGEPARILVVTWASGEPAEAFAGLREEIEAQGARHVAQAPMPPFEPASREAVLRSIREATGIFLSGGDQSRIMEVCRDAQILELLRERYRAGVVFGGTSAGTAAVSTPMITGEGDFTVIDGAKVEVREGLGLLPGVILDQHFVKRQRENRLFGLILSHPRLLGMGVDEDTALLVRDGRLCEVAGAGPVVVVEAVGPSSLGLDLLRAGEGFDLAKRRRFRVQTPEPGR